MLIINSLNDKLHHSVQAIRSAFDVIEEHDPWRWFYDNTISGRAEGATMKIGELLARFEADFEAGADLSWIEPYLLDNLNEQSVKVTGEAFAALFRLNVERYNAAVNLLNNWDESRSVLQKTTDYEKASAISLEALSAFAADVRNKLSPVTFFLETGLDERFPREMREKAQQQSKKSITYILEQLDVHCSRKELSSTLFGLTCPACSVDHDMEKVEGSSAACRAYRCHNCRSIFDIDTVAMPLEIRHRLKSEAPAS